MGTARPWGIARGAPRSMAYRVRPSRVRSGQLALGCGEARPSRSSRRQSKKVSTGWPSRRWRGQPSRFSALWFTARIRPSSSKASSPSLNRPT
ncbi:Uncharacterised protein [Acinetobacter baumannii]|nr:Uncharacterised protein [Acinetobacter baumannii]